MLADEHPRADLGVRQSVAGESGDLGLLGGEFIRVSGPEAVDAVMAHLNGTVLRRSFLDVQAEIAAAEDAQREAKKKARTELRGARNKQQRKTRPTPRSPN